MTPVTAPGTAQTQKSLCGRWVAKLGDMSLSQQLRFKKDLASLQQVLKRTVTDTQWWGRAEPPGSRYVGPTAGPHMLGLTPDFLCLGVLRCQRPCSFRGRSTR